MKSFFEKLSRNGVEKEHLSALQSAILAKLIAQGGVACYKNRYYINNGFVAGELKILRHKEAVVEEFESGERFVVGKQFLGGAKSGDCLLLEVKKGRKSGFGRSAYKANVKSAIILKRAKNTQVLLTKKVGEMFVGVDFVSRLSQSLKGAKEICENVVVKADAEGEIIEVLGRFEDEAVDEKISLAIFEKRDSFGAQTLAEARKMLEEFQEKLDKTLTHAGDRTAEESNSVLTNSQSEDASGVARNGAQNASDETESKTENAGKSVKSEGQNAAKRGRKRVDLSALSFCTIDPDDAKDFDDAIFYDSKKRWLYVAIADVAEFVKEGSQCDYEAQERAFSIYFPHKAVPMLPRDLSENLCSLRPFERRFVLVFKFEFDENLEVKESELFEAVICSKRRFTYSQVDEILAKNRVEEAGLEWILPLFEVSQKWRAERLKHGFDFTSLELRMQLAEDLSLQSCFYERQTPSHSLIEECMLQANKAAARMISKGIFRSHAAANKAKIATLAKEVGELGIKVGYTPRIHALIEQIQQQARQMGILEAVDAMIIKAQQKACYTPFCEGHFGLGFTHYTHFTSPIRRYSDLLLHRILKAKLGAAEESNSVLTNAIERAAICCEEVTQKEVEADRVAFDFKERKFARWAARNIGREFVGVVEKNESKFETKNDRKRHITRKNSTFVLPRFECVVRLSEQMCGGRILVKNSSAKLLSKVVVQITSADTLSGEIQGKITRQF